MRAPWNVRVTPMHNSFVDPIEPYLIQPDYYKVEIRFRGEWLDAGTARTWWSAFFQGIAS